MTPRQRALAVVGIGGLVGAISSLFAYGYVQQLLDETRAELSAGDRKTNVAVAARQLPWGAVLTDDAIRIVPFPSESVPDGHFSASEGLVGRVLLAPLASQEPILASKLAPSDVVTGGVAAITHPAKRAMAIKVDDVTAVGGVLKPESGGHPHHNVANAERRRTGDEIGAERHSRAVDRPRSIGRKNRRTACR